jgi:hypothetical protein
MEFGVAKYATFRQHLERAPAQRITMSFTEIERIVGRPLPRSHRARSWWSNNPQNSGLTREWLAAGFMAENVDLDRRTLVFSRMAKQPLAETGGAPACRHPAFGAMKGMVTIAEGYDLTLPLDEPWGSSWDHKSI